MSRTHRSWRWLVPALLLGLAATAAAGPITRVGLVGITVSDLDRSVRFFTEVLSFHKTWEAEIAGDSLDRLRGVFGLRARVARLRLGTETVELTEYLTPHSRPLPVGARSYDRSFQHLAIVVSDMGRAYRHLRLHRVRHVSTGPQRLPNWNPAAGGIRAFYFQDPDGHVLELIQFPPGKGDPRWQRPGKRLFLGIDHTAIVTADTERSLRWYRDQLGLRVAGQSENYGQEQEHLNHVFGARLRITALRAGAGPGIELLEYLAPRGGRPYPPDARASDLVHWSTRLEAPDARRLVRSLPGELRRLVSPGVVSLEGAPLGFRRGVLLRDPDGHALEIVEPAPMPARGGIRGQGGPTTPGSGACRGPRSRSAGIERCAG